MIADREKGEVKVFFSTRGSRWMMVVSLLRNAATIATRIVIVAVLLAMLPMAVMGLAASGPTLSNPEDEWRVGGIFLSYIVADLLVLMLLTLRPSQRWLWLLGGAIAFMPIVTVVLVSYWNGEL